MTIVKQPISDRKMRFRRVEVASNVGTSRPLSGGLPSRMSKGAEAHISTPRPVVDGFPGFCTGKPLSNSSARFPRP